MVRNADDVAKFTRFGFCNGHKLWNCGRIQWKLKRSNNWECCQEYK